jgi:hypothetical protein
VLVGAAPLLARLLAVLAPGPLPNASEIFQADERVGMGLQDTRKVITLSQKPERL